MVISAFATLLLGLQAGAAEGRPFRPPDLFGRIDGNRDGAISQAEWKQFFRAADRDRDGTLTRPEWLRSLRRRVMTPDPAPKAGDPVPKLKAKNLKDDSLVDLSRPRRTTVLIFGSYT